MSSLAILLLAIVVVGNTTGQLLFKGCSMRAEKAEAAGRSHWQALAADPLLWVALSLYVLEFFIWLAFLSVVPLWQGVMVACVDILLVMVGGRIFFGERLTPARIGAISLIAIGVMLVGAGGGSS